MFNTPLKKMRVYIEYLNNFNSMSLKGSQLSQVKTQNPIKLKKTNYECNQPNYNDRHNSFYMIS